MGFPGTATTYKCIENEGSKAGFARKYNSLVLSCEDGGTKNKYLVELAKEIWKYLLLYEITITVEYLTSFMNVEADWQSRNSKDHLEWKLISQVFQTICQIKEKQEMDVFAS